MDTAHCPPPTHLLILLNMSCVPLFGRLNKTFISRNAT